MKEIHIYTDGSSRGNPGPSGWAVVLFVDQEVIELGGRVEYGTNNQMELQAVVSALSYIESNALYDFAITIYIDSAYVQKGITLWMYAWEKNDWQTKTGDPVQNQELWKEALYTVFRLKRKVIICFEKVAGHADVFGNERADVLATLFADAIATPLFHGGKKEYLKLYEHVQTRSVSSKNKSSSKKAYSYVSLVGGVVYCDKDWSQCEERVKGVKGAKYKKALTKEDEVDIIHEFTKTL